MEVLGSFHVLRTVRVTLLFSTESRGFQERPRSKQEPYRWENSLKKLLCVRSTAKHPGGILILQQSVNPNLLRMQ